MSNFLRFSIVLVVKSNCECGTFIISHELIVLIRHLPADGLPCCSHLIVSLCQATKTYKKTKTIEGSTVTWQTMVRSVSHSSRGWPWPEECTLTWRFYDSDGLKTEEVSAVAHSKPAAKVGMMSNDVK